MGNANMKDKISDEDEHSTDSESTTNIDDDRYPEAESDDYVHLTLLLVEGYIKQNAKYNIDEINRLCIDFYGHYAKHIAYISERHNWFQQKKQQNDIPNYQIADNLHLLEIKNNIKLASYPITQYIDETHQILFASICGFQYIAWKGFLCINMVNNEIHRVRATIQNDQFYLIISVPLEIRSKHEQKDENYAQFMSRWLKPKYEENLNVNDDIDDIINDIDFWDDSESFTFKYNIWQRFADNLWDLFIMNRLYNPDIAIQEQQIWRVIHFLSLLYFEDNHCHTNIGHLTVPHLILNSNDNDKSFKMFEPFKIFEVLITRQMLDIWPGFEDFDVDKDCNAEIIEYEYGKILKCKCYLYADWGAGYHVEGGCDQNLYCVIFEIQKPNINVQIKFDVDIIQTHSVDGVALT